MFNRILIPLDGSKLARQVFPHAVELARAFGSEVVLIGVCEPEESEYGQACRLYIGSEAEQFKKDVGEDSKVSVKTEVLVGKSAEAILDYAGKNDIDLLIMASHGRSGIMPWSLGSTVTKVLHRVDIPLVIARAKETPTESDKVGLFSKILIPLDGSDTSLVVLSLVAELTQKITSEVTLFQAISSGKHVHTIGGLDYVRFADFDVNSMKESARKYLDRLAEKFAGTRAKVKTEVRVGDVAHEIIKYATEGSYSLITILSHGHSGIERFVHGSVSYKILQASEKSVLIVPPSGAKK